MGDRLKFFRIKTEKGAFLIKGDLVKRLEQGTDFIIFAEDKAKAQSLATRFVGEKITYTSPHVVHADFDVDWIERLDLDDPRYKARKSYSGAILTRTSPPKGKQEGRQSPS